MEHRTNKYLKLLGILAPLAATAWLLIAAGEMREATKEEKATNETTLAIVKVNTVRLYNIESNLEKRVLTDSLDRKDRTEDRKVVNAILKRTTRIEWYLKLKPIELDNMTPLKMKPFGETSESIKVERN